MALKKDEYQFLMEWAKQAKQFHYIVKKWPDEPGHYKAFSEGGIERGDFQVLDNHPQAESWGVGYLEYLT
mgnify:CR=1 FL=1